VLFDVLGIINPVAQRRAALIQRYAESAAEAMTLLPGMWQYHLAAMISQLGCITLPQETLSRALSGQALSHEERRMYESHPEIAGKCSGQFAARGGCRRMPPPTGWRPPIFSAARWRIAALPRDHSRARASGRDHRGNRLEPRN